MSPTLESLLSNLSAWTWHFLRDAPFRPREETLTETLLTEFVRQGKGHVWVHKATVKEENTLGLDWAWALRTDAGWVTALVQAKQIGGITVGVYKELRKRDAIVQAEHLLHAAGMVEALPLFAFYNSEVATFGAEGTNVSMGGCLRNDLVRRLDKPPWHSCASPLGVSLAHAEDVRSRGISPPGANQRAVAVNTYSMPWECMLCPAWRASIQSPEAYAPSSLLEVAAFQLGREIRRRNEGQIDGAEAGAPAGDVPWIHAEMPRWAQLVRDGRRPGGDGDVPDTEFLLVVDLIPDGEEA